MGMFLNPDFFLASERGILAAIIRFEMQDIYGLYVI